MRVAIDATPLYGPRTGIGRFTAEVLAGLAAHPGVEPIAYAVTYRGRGRLGGLVPAGVATARRPMAAAPLRELWRRTDMAPIEWWVGPVAVVHGTNFVVPPSRAAQVVTVHDLTVLRHPEMCTTDAARHPGLVRRALARGAWVHTPSHHVRVEVIDLLGADPQRVVAVPNGVTRTPPGDPARGRRLAGGAPYVVAIGTVEPRKDLPLLVRAFDQAAAVIGDLRLVVAGPDGWGVEAYRHAVAQAAHRDRVVRLGYVDEATRADLLAGAAALALPSRYEGFGLTAAEALVAGTPVVATAAGAVPEVLGEAGLLVPAGDLGALAGALERVVADEELASDLRRRGPEQAARFSWARTVDGLVELWRAAAQG